MGLLNPQALALFASSLAIQAAVRPNPVVGVEPIAWFALHNSGPTTLEVFTVSGKRIGKIDLGALGPGTHTQNLQGLLGSRPGIYLVRLTQGEASTTCKMVQL